MLKKQATYIHKHTVREEVSQVRNEHKRRRYLFLSSFHLLLLCSFHTLSNFLSYSVFMYVACLFLSHFAFEKEPCYSVGSKRKAINIYFAFILVL